MDMYGTEDEPSVIVQLSNRVQDGTRCRPGSLDMCIQGKCQVIINNDEYDDIIKIKYIKLSRDSRAFHIHYLIKNYVTCN